MQANATGDMRGASHGNDANLSLWTKSIEPRLRCLNPDQQARVMASMEKEMSAAMSRALEPNKFIRRFLALTIILIVLVILAHVIVL